MGATVRAAKTRPPFQTGGGPPPVATPALGTARARLLAVPPVTGGVAPGGLQARATDGPVEVLVGRADAPAALPAAVPPTPLGRRALGRPPSGAPAKVRETVDAPPVRDAVPGRDTVPVGVGKGALPRPAPVLQAPVLAQTPPDVPGVPRRARRVEVVAVAALVPIAATAVGLGRGATADTRPASVAATEGDAVRAVTRLAPPEVGAVKPDDTPSPARVRRVLGKVAVDEGLALPRRGPQEDGLRRPSPAVRLADVQAV